MGLWERYLPERDVRGKNGVWIFLACHGQMKKTGVNYVAAWVG
jgi:hypothetical protein